MSLQADALQHGTQSRPWNLADRIVFRFCLIYLASFSLCTQIATSLFPIPKIDIPDLDSFWPMSQIVLWTIQSPLPQPSRRRSASESPHSAPHKIALPKFFSCTDLIKIHP